MTEFIYLIYYFRHSVLPAICRCLMSTNKSPHLFRQGIASEVSCFLSLLCVLLIVIDAGGRFG